MKWSRNGQIFAGRLAIDGRVSFIVGEPPAELMRSLGYEEYTPPAPEPAPEDPDFGKVKAAFWSYVDEAAAALSEVTGHAYTRADFPTGAYSTDLLAWCAEHGLTEAATGLLAVKFCGIAADLARLGRNWNDLFDTVTDTQSGE